METAHPSGSPAPEENQNQQSNHEQVMTRELAQTHAQKGRIALFGFLKRGGDHQTDTRPGNDSDIDKDVVVALAKELKPRAYAQLARANRIFGEPYDPTNEKHTETKEKEGAQKKLGPIDYKATREARRGDPKAEMVRAPNKMQKKYMKQVAAAEKEARARIEKNPGLQDRYRKEPEIDSILDGVDLTNVVNTSHMPEIDLKVDAEFKRRIEGLGHLSKREQATIREGAVRTVLNTEATAAFSDTQSEEWMQRFKTLNGLYSNYLLEKQRNTDREDKRARERAESFTPISGLNESQVKVLDETIQGSIKKEVGERFKNQSKRPDDFHIVKGKSELKEDVFDKLCKDIIFANIRHVIINNFGISKDTVEFTMKFGEVSTDRNNYRAVQKAKSAATKTSGKTT